jgi:hypothetical protein
VLLRGARQTARERLWNQRLFNMVRLGAGSCAELKMA